MPSQRRPRRRATAPVVPVPKNGSSTRSPGLVVASRMREQQRLGLLRGVRLASLAVLEPLGAGADREQPVGAHLDVVVEGLHGLVVERHARFGVASRPDQRLVRVGEALAAEVRHRIGLAPDHVVLDPEAQVLQRDAEAEDVVIGADHPDGAVGLQHAPALAKPGTREAVVVSEGGELVPGVVDAVDHRVVGAQQLPLELEVVGRIGEHEIDARVRELRQLLQAIADEDAVRRDGSGQRNSQPPGGALTQGHGTQLAVTLLRAAV